MLSIMAEHTHYFDGFGVYLPMPNGCAVAVRRAGDEPSEVFFDGVDATWRFDELAGDGWPAPWVGVFQRLIARRAKGGVKVAVVTTVPPASPDAYLASLGIALYRAMRDLEGAEGDPEVEPARRIIELCARRPTGRALLLAAAAGHDVDSVTVVDAARGELLPIPRPPVRELGWGLIDCGIEAQPDEEIAWERRAQADMLVPVLQEAGFEIETLRDLEHRDLEAALGAVSNELRSTLRFLVSENRRVYRLITALRRPDGQLAGALLLMGHAAMKGDWQNSTYVADFVVESVEERALEGLFGARQVGHGSAVVVAGKGVSLPEALDGICAEASDRFETPVRSYLL